MDGMMRFPKGRAATIAPRLGGPPVVAPRLGGSPPTTDGTGYPWVDGDILYAADLNAALAGGASVAALNPITGTYGIQSFPNFGDFYISPDSYAMTGLLTIRGQPYGGYDTGCLLSMVATTEPIQYSRAGIFAPAGPGGIASYSTLDQVGIYNQVGSCHPPLVLNNVSYDATHVYPNPPLTAAQIKLLRLNMWVYTNSIDPSIVITPGTQDKENHYTSYIESWAADGSSITVGGWAVAGSGNGAAGQVPSTSYDPGSPGPICYFGSPTNVFCGNFVCHHDPVTYPDARSKYYQGIEFDFVNYSSVDYQAGFYGLSLVYSPQQNAKATTDSYGIKVSGFPTGVIANYSNIAFRADNSVTGFWANCSQTNFESTGFNVYVWASPPAWSGSPVTNLTWESMNYVDGDQLRLQCWVSRDVGGGTIGWSSASLHLGLRINGAPLSMTGGSPMAQLVWNPPGWGGGFQLQTLGGGGALGMDINGGIHFLAPAPSAVTFGNLPFNAANDAAASSGGVGVGGVYRNGSVLMIRVS